MPGHAICDQRYGYLFFRKLPRREPRALKEGARFVREYSYALARLDRGANHAERGAEPCGRQRARVAVSQHGRVVRYKLCAERAHPLVAFNIFAVNLKRFVDERLFDLLD